MCAARRSNNSAGLDQSGYTLAETLMTCIVLSLSMLTLSTFVRFTVQNSLRIQRSAETELDRSLTQFQLSSLMQYNLPGYLWINPTVTKELKLPWAETDGIAVSANGADGSILVSPNKTLRMNSNGTPPSLLADQAGSFDAIALLQRSSETPGLTLAPLAQPDPAHLFSPLALGGDLQVNESTTSYQAGDLLAILSPVGVEFVKIQSISNSRITFATLGQYKMGTQTTTLPGNFLPPGTIVFKVRVQLLGVELSSDYSVRTLKVINIDPRTAAYRIAHSMQWPSDSAQSQRLKIKTDSGPVAVGSFATRSPGMFIQLKWNKSTLQSSGPAAQAVETLVAF
jgi:hypothetical protein